jgi:glycosyltransferase involved in cell wall biosynthesis
MALGSDTFHLQSPSRRKRILAACTQAKGIICVAQVLADRLAAAGVPQAKLHVIPNGVSPLTPSLSPEGRGRRASILYVGNLVPVKGPDILLQAFASLTTQQPCHTTTTLTLIGAGPMRSKLERLARTLGIGDQVRFLGRRPPEEVADWMNRADVLCLPSRSEGMPNVVLEARACGLPVVASPAGAIPELPLDKTHFLVVPACTPAHLAAGLHDMLSRDLSKRIPDPNIPTWKTMAERILAKIERGV